MNRYMRKRKPCTRPTVLEALEARALLTGGVSDMDVTADGIVSPADVVTLVNCVNNGSAEPGSFDLNGDGTLSGGDVLPVINFLNEMGMVNVPVDDPPPVDVPVGERPEDVPPEEAPVDEVPVENPPPVDVPVGERPDDVPASPMARREPPELPDVAQNPRWRVTSGELPDVKEVVESSIQDLEEMLELLAVPRGRGR